MMLLSIVKIILGSIPNVYIGSMPKSPDNVVGLYNTGGYPRGLTESKLRSPTFQVRVRSDSYADGIAVCDNIDELLHGYTGNDTLLIRNMGDINDIGRDKNDRPEFTMNYTAYFL